MRYRVEWDPQCYPQFDEILASGLSVERLKHCVRLIDIELSVHATAKGQHLSEGLYKIDALAIRAYYHVDEINQIAAIDGVCWLEDS